MISNLHSVPNGVGLSSLNQPSSHTSLGGGNADGTESASPLLMSQVAQTEKSSTLQWVMSPCIRKGKEK